MPIVPVAPGRFSTSTGWPSFAASPLERPRTSGSTAPPAGKGTTMRIGFEGHASWARAAGARTSAQAIAITWSER